ncbi:hypothetical protein ISCGN_019933 [Ixodes scapularis]
MTSVLKSAALLKSVRVPKARQTVQEKAAGLFQGCLNRSQLERQGSAPWWDVIRGLGVSVFPLTPLEKEPPVALETLAAAMMRHLGLGPLASITLAATPGNRSTVALYLRPPKLRVREAGSLWNQTSKALQALTGRLPETRLVRSLLEFQRQVEQASAEATNPVAPFVPRYRTLRVFSLPQNKMWNWRNFFATLLEDVVPLQTVDVVVVFPAYLDALGQLLLKTERAVVYNYLVLELLLESSPLVPSSLSPHVALPRRNGGPRTERLCVRLVQELMSHAATALLARPFVEQATATRANVRDMLTRVVDELKHQLIDYPWMQDAVSQYAIQKLNGVQEHLLYPPFVEDKMVLEQIYRQVPDLTGQTPLADWFRARSAIMLKRWKALSGKGLSPLWDIHYTEPSVTYLHDSNELEDQARAYSRLNVIPSVSTQRPLARISVAISASRNERDAGTRRRQDECVSCFAATLAKLSHVCRLRRVGRTMMSCAGLVF